MKRNKTVTENLLRSKVLQDVFVRLDHTIHGMECTIQSQQDKIKELQDDIGGRLSEQIKKDHDTQAQILIAALGQAPASWSIGPVGAVVLANIYGMNSVDEIRKYINSIGNATGESSESDTGREDKT